MLSKKTRYAMLAMVALAREYGRCSLTAGRIAEVEHVPKRVLEAILLKLRSNGCIGSTRGKTGGYYLMRPPQEITLLEIVEMFGGAVSMLACICADNDYRPCEFCKDESTCSIRSTFSSIYRNTADILRRTTLADLVAGSSAVG